MKYNCKTCNFHTNRLSKWNRHLQTNKHKNGNEPCRYVCGVCCFYTHSKTNLSQHLNTNTHDNRVLQMKKLNPQFLDSVDNESKNTFALS